MRYYNKKRQLADTALCKMLAHLYHQKGLREDKCIYTDKGGKLLFARLPEKDGPPLVLYLIAHGMQGQAGITDRLESRGKQVLRGTALSFKVNRLLTALEVPTDRPVHVKLPFCYGGLKQPSLQAFVEQFKAKMEAGNCHLKVSYDDDSPTVTTVSGEGAMPVAAVQALLDAELKAHFYPEEERARKAIAEMKWDAGEQDGTVWNRSLAQEIVVNLRDAFGAFTNVACGGFEHPMSYVTSDDLPRGAKPLPDKATFPITVHPSFDGLERLHKSSAARRAKKVHFDTHGKMVGRPEKHGNVQRFCYFPFHFETSRWRLLKIEGLEPPEFDEAWRPFY